MSDECLLIIYLRNLIKILTEGQDNEEERLRAFYYLMKYIVTNKELLKSDLQLCMAVERLLIGVSVEMFITYFPITKEYDGARYEIKDYYSTIQAVKEQGKTIGNDVFGFLWDYRNTLVEKYMVQQLCLLSRSHEQEVGKGLLENFFEIKPLFLKRIGGREVLYDSSTGKTKPIKRYKRRAKWLRLVK